MEMKKERKNMDVKVLSSMNVLKKLQLAVSLIFIFMTLGIILVVVNWGVAAAFFIIGYLATFALMVKLLLAKKL